MEKSCRKCAPKGSPRPLFNFGEKPKTPIPCKKIFLKFRCIERGLSKILKKVNLFFLLNPVPFNGHCYKKKRGLELVTSGSSGY